MLFVTIIIIFKNIGTKNWIIYADPICPTRGLGV